MILMYVSLDNVVTKIDLYKLKQFTCCGACRRWVINNFQT